MPAGLLAFPPLAAARTRRDIAPANEARPLLLWFRTHSKPFVAGMASGGLFFSPLLQNDHTFPAGKIPPGRG